jgi:hypothetical protein
MVPRAAPEEFEKKTVSELVTADDTITPPFNSELALTLTRVVKALSSVPYGSLELLDTVGPDARGRHAAPPKNYF